MSYSKKKKRYYKMLNDGFKHVEILGSWPMEVIGNCRVVRVFFRVEGFCVNKGGRVLKQIYGQFVYRAFPIQ